MAKLSSTKLGNTRDRPIFVELVSAVAGKTIFRVRGLVTMWHHDCNADHT